MLKQRKHMRGQSTVELLVLLGISLLALLIIYSLYGQQMQFSATAREASTAKATIERMVTAANSLSISGAGSKTTVLVELPLSLRMENSAIVGNELLLQLRNRTDVVGSADVNFSGDWKREEGVFVKGGYYATLVFDGNAVNIIYDDFELSTQSVSIQAKQNTVSLSSFTLRNTSSTTATFSINPNFSNSPFAVLLLGEGDDNFSLGADEMRTIDYNISTNSSAYGDYSGSFDIIGQLNDGYRDYNITKQVIVSLEVFLDPADVRFYPPSKSYELFSGATQSGAFSLCNFSDSNIPLAWSKDSNADANMVSWFSLPPSDSIGVINDAYGGVCRDFNITISPPAGSVSNNYDANFTVTYNSTLTSTGYLYAKLHNWKSLFFTTQNDFDSNANLSSSRYFKSTSGLGAAIAPSGELDFNSSANYTYNSADYNRDMNLLVAYYKFNDKNSSGYILNSATNLRQGQLAGGMDVNVFGLWDTNAGYFDGSDDYVDLGNSSDLSLTGDFSIFAWVNYKSFATSNYWEHAIVARDEGPGATNKWIFTVTSQTGGTHLEYYNTSIGSNTELNGNLWNVTLGAWNYLGIVKQGNNFTFYRNGMPDGTAVSANALSSTINANVKVGFAESKYFNGSIDELKIYKRALSSSEVAADYNNFLSTTYVSEVKSVSVYSFNSAVLNTDQNYSFGHELDTNDKFFDANLVALWHFDDKNSGGWMLNSATGVRDANFLNGADTNAVGLWDTNAGYFDGVNDYVYTPFNPDSSIGDNKPFTVSIWAYPKNITSNQVSVGCGNWAVSPVQRWFFGVYLGAWDWGLGNTYDIATGVTAMKDAWQHVVWSYDGSKMYMYFNGVPVYSKAYTGIGNYPSLALPLGALNQSGSIVQYYNGYLDEVAIWNRSFSAVEASSLFRKGASRLDLNISSCSDAACASVTGTKQFTSVKHNTALDISSLELGNYLKYSLGFKYLPEFSDNNYTPFKAYSGFAALSDLNISYAD